MTSRLQSEWTPRERGVLKKLRTPALIQDFLDRTPYSTDHFYRSPRRVLRDHRAHCFDGALLAACALEQQGDPPLIVDLRAVRDDDHVITVFQRHAHWGAVAKSNCVGLRYREPIYRNLRELVMSYFDDYFNTAGEKSLREYSIPFDLRRFDRVRWRQDDAPLAGIAQRLDDAPHRTLLTPAMVRGLAPVDRRSYEAGFLGSNPAGLYQAKKRA
jgi:hypothetical protein